MLTALLLLAVPDFEIEYESTAPPKYEVVVFLSTECPLAKLYANRLSELADRYPQFHFQGISANEQDSAAEIAQFQKSLRFGFKSNPATITRLGATRSPEVFVLVNDRVVYQGRIDDQYAPGANRAEPTRRDLEEAIREVLAGQPVSVAKTPAAGCLISISGDSGREITFDQVAPVLHQKCTECHRPGEIAPFPLLTYQDALGWKDTIKEVVLQNRMPPWHADPKHGKFANDRSLTDLEKSLLVRWVDAGAPVGEDELNLPEFRSGWALQTDVLLKVPEPFSVPAEGVLDYQEFTLDPGFTEDTWIQGIEVRPGNTSVVHHINVVLRPKGAEPDSVYLNSVQDLFFTVMVPGNMVTVWPAGTAKRVPAGWDIVLSVHYQPNGTPQTDQTTVALQLADPGTVRQQIATRGLIGSGFELPPNQVTTLTNTWTLDDDFTLYALMPHMHLRGKSMRVEADGEVLLNVPQFDFNWQHRYVLAEPRQLKRGTVILCTAEYDNTADNPHNPDPGVTVREGRQSTDEMFQLNLDVTKTHENRLANPYRIPLTIVTALVCGLLFLFFRQTE